MSRTIPNPALQQFVRHLDQLGGQLALAQVRVRRVPAGFELCHVADADAPADSLREVPRPGLRALAQQTTEGAFRPVKAAPNLIRGWRTLAGTEEALGDALEQLYPGAVADWFAAQQAPPPVTSYREFTARQTGMYRITTMLDNAQAARMIAACCAADSCLKRRLWTVPGLAPDAADAKSLIPCLEPCAVLLEFARQAARLEQADRTSVALAPGEIETLQAALRLALTQPAAGAREADFGAALNTRRARLLLARISAATPDSPAEAEPSAPEK